MATGALPEHEFKRHPWLKDIAVLVKPVSNSAILSMVEKVLNEGKDIPKKNIDSKELASTNFKVVSLKLYLRRRDGSRRLRSGRSCRGKIRQSGGKI